jgi:DHA2 family methylenomycin A resistance protein-like MFS transporter
MDQQARIKDVATPTMAESNARQEQPEQRAAHPRLVLFALCLGYFMVILDITVVNVAMPDIQARLGATVSGLQWIVAGYSLIFASLLLTAGMLGDWLGSRRIFLLGLALFTIASALCGLAPMLLALQLFRLLQGVGAALMVPASLALLNHTIVPAQRARAIGIWGSVAGIGAVSGPVVGGFLVSALTWRGIFLINIPIGTLGCALTLAFVPKPPRLAQRGLDLPAQALAILGPGMLTFALIEGSDLGWTHPLILSMFVLFVLAVVLFILREQRATHPMLPLSLFSRATFAASNVVGMLLNFGFYGQFFVMNLYFPHLLGLSPWLTGLALLPESSMVFIASILAGRVAERYGPRLPMALGLAIGGLGMLSLILVQTHTAYLLLCPALMATGFGTAFTMPAMTAAVIASAPGERSGSASGVLNASRQIGQVLGTALLGSLVAASRSLLSGNRI